MNRKWLPYLLILLLGAVLFFVRRCVPARTGSSTNSQGKKTNGAGNRNHGFDRRVSYIEYTVHAKCRMQCRNISQSEVEEIMQQGTINYRKSEVNDRPCPTYALEGTTHDDQRVRIVFAQCDLKTKVVTCIDLGKDWECHCPGDDDPYKNKK